MTGSCQRPATRGQPEDDSAIRLEAGSWKLEAVRLLVLLAAALTCLASSGSNESRRDPGTGPTGSGGMWCHNEQGPTGKIASQCRATPEACESERASAQAGGLAVSSCAQVPQVACFQLGGDPAPAAEWCAASFEDCEFWKHLDEQKNGPSGQRCDWRR
jgi:hypothetical protein